MEAKFYVKCECTKDGGREVCVAQVSIGDVDTFTDEQAEQLLRRIEYDCSQKFGVNPSDCKAEFVPHETFLEYGGPLAALAELARHAQEKKCKEQEDTAED